MMRFKLRSHATILGSLALAVAIGATLAGGIAALASSSAGVIHACVNNTNGNLRAVPAGRSCRRGEHPTSWNQVGPAGPNQLVAFGSVAIDGSKQSGTANVTTSWDSLHHSYNVAIAGVTYTDSAYATLITMEQGAAVSPCVGTRAISSEDQGHLVVVVDDGAGSPTQCGFHFVVIKP